MSPRIATHSRGSDSESAPSTDMSRHLDSNHESVRQIIETCRKGKVISRDLPPIRPLQSMESRKGLTVSDRRVESGRDMESNQHVEHEVQSQ